MNNKHLIMYTVISRLFTVHITIEAALTNKYNLLERHWEEYIKEEDLVAPDNPLFLCLSVQPTWPLVLDELNLRKHVIIG